MIKSSLLPLRVEDTWAWSVGAPEGLEDTERLHSCRAHTRFHMYQKPEQKQSSKFMEHKTYHAGLTQVGTC